MTYNIIIYHCIVLYASIIVNYILYIIYENFPIFQLSIGIAVRKINI